MLNIDGNDTAYNLYLPSNGIRHGVDDNEDGSLYSFIILMIIQNHSR